MMVEGYAFFFKQFYAKRPIKRTFENGVDPDQTPQNVEAVLTSTHNLCFEQKFEKYQIYFIWKIAMFWW